MAKMPRSAVVPVAAALLTALVSAVAHAQPPEQPVSGCESCHGQLADPRLAAPVEQFLVDVHRERGFSCANCHGGNPLTTDQLGAMDPARGYRGRLSGAAVIAACARCHSDSEVMRRYAPAQRIDQATQYATSVHGQRLGTGDDRVAICTSCHHAHGIRRVSDVRSPVYPLNVAATCASCHGNPQHMERPAGAEVRSVPTDQLAEYQKSVHYAALTHENDLSAPTCNDCHGNHGAAPPGVGSVVNVCGTCHAVFAQRFERSVHREIFDRGCVECHGNHAIQPPGDDLLSTGEEGLCRVCHEEDAGVAAADHMRGAIERLNAAIQQAGELTRHVGNAGMEVSDQELALAETRNRLTLARMEVHAFDPATVDLVIDEGLGMVAAIERTLQQQLTQLRFRRVWFTAFLATCLLVVLALALKIRAIDHRPGMGHSSSR